MTKIEVERQDLYICWGWALEALSSLPREQLPPTENLLHVEDALNRVYEILTENRP